MQVFNMEQGSEEWLNIRMGTPTATSISSIVTPTGKLSKSYKKLASDLAADSLVSDPDDIFKSKYMDRGSELEDEAISSYEEKTLNKVDRVGFVVRDGIGSSPDGLIESKGVLEVKCPAHREHVHCILAGKPPLKYIPQIQGNLFTTGREWCDFVSYHPGYKIEPLKTFIVRVKRDEDYIKKLMEFSKVVLDERDLHIKKLLNMS